MQKQAQYSIYTVSLLFYKTKKKTQNLSKQHKQLTLLPILWNNNDLEIPSLTQPYKT